MSYFESARFRILREPLVKNLLRINLLRLSWEYLENYVSLWPARLKIFRKSPGGTFENLLRITHYFESARIRIFWESLKNLFRTSWELFHTLNQHLWIVLPPPPAPSPPLHKNSGAAPLRDFFPGNSVSRRKTIKKETKKGWIFFENSSKIKKKVKI